MSRWTAAVRGTTRAFPALVVLGGCLAAAVAYAAAGPGPREPSARTADELRRQAPHPRSARPPRPSITGHPEKASTSTAARFAFRALRGAPRFQCRLDGGGWRRCQTPITYHGLGTGEHAFSVRAVGRRGRRGAAAKFRWTLFEPRSFSIEPRLSGLGPLYPGAAAQPLPVVLRNPNPVQIFVTGLRAAATGGPLGCDGAANLELTPSSASTAAPLAVPSGGSVHLPTSSASAPAIALRDLPFNQDACQGARFPLAFSGEAHG
jgi:hypothetical protein